MANEITVSATTCAPMDVATVIKAPAGEIIAVGEVVQMGTAGTWLAAQADSAAHQNGLLGIVVAGGKATETGAIAAGEMTAVVILGPVFLGVDAALDETGPVYVSATADGYLTQTKPATYWRVVGWPESPTVLNVLPDPGGASS